MHGLIASTFDQSTDAEWGCTGIQIIGATGLAIGTGNQNTIDIVNTCSESNAAAIICSSLIWGGYKDWYLPSKDELSELYLHRYIIGGSPEGPYWSSSEHNNTNSWAQDFSTGEQQEQFKSHQLAVRAVRSF